jgi:cytidylate kinase
MVIAIDGPAGSGKSTIAGLLAERLSEEVSAEKQFTYINSGKLYRAITLGCLRNNINPTDSDKVVDYAGKIKISYQKDNKNNNYQVFLDGENVTEYLHTDEIDRHSAPLSSIVPVRHIVNKIIREIAAGSHVVVEGRDMTTVVFPDAEYRFYLDASADSRAKRRFNQGVSNLKLDEIKKAILERDEIDKNKAEGSLKIHEGVDYLDTSDLTIIQVYEKLKGKINI